MTKREKYHITFQKLLTPSGRVNYVATTNLMGSSDIASHLRNCGKTSTKSQISEINDAVNRFQKGWPVDDFWGEVMGSSLFIYPESDIVTVDDAETSVPIPDFLKLLQEWLEFIS